MNNARNVSEASGEQTTNKKNPFVLLENPYYGIMALLAWFYCFWFVSDAFRDTDLLNWTITRAWVVFLATTTVSLLGLFVYINRSKRHEHLSEFSGFDIASTAILAVGGLLLQIRLEGMPIWLLCYALPTMLGVAFSCMWVLWGEHYTRSLVSFSVLNVSAAYACVTLGSLLIAYLLPPVINAVGIAALPVFSLYKLRQSAFYHNQYPKMLPQKTRKAIHRNLAVVCSVVLATSALSYFTIAIIPLWELSFGNDTFTLGVALSSVGMALVGILAKFQPKQFSIYRIFPWMLIFTIAASLLYLAGNASYFTLAFLLSLMLCSMYAVTLIMYSGILTKKGYLSPSMAFSLCGICVYGGICLGNSIAIFFENNLSLELLFLQPVTIALILIVMFCVIPFLRQESRFEEIMTPVEKVSDLDVMVQAAADEFELSPRETEILGLLARNLSVDRIARDLYISNYTVQTHIQHIYTKTGIHKRSELIDYLNKRE